MKKAAIKGLFLLLIVAVLIPSFALAEDTTLWGLELGGSFERTPYDMGQVKYFTRYHAQLYQENPPLATNGFEEFSLANQGNLRLGVRCWRIIGGIQLSRLYSTNTSFSYGRDMNGEFMESGTFKVDVDAKEYLFYLGYIQPVLPWFDVVVLGMMGPSIANANMVDYSTVYDERTAHEMDTDYTASRIEGRLRFHVRENMGIEFCMGYRQSQPTNMRGDIKTDGIVTTTDTRVAAPGGDELEFDFSGMYIGLGILLKNPLGRE